MRISGNLSYRAKLIGVYISFTLTGILLTVIAILNASQQHRTMERLSTAQAWLNQLQPDIEKIRRLDNTASIYASQPGQHTLQIQQCEFTPPEDLLQNELIENAGVYDAGDCVLSWFTYQAVGTSEPLIIFQRIDPQQPDYSFTAYQNRVIIPLAFFIWLTVWGSLMLGNLVKKLQQQKEDVEHIALHDALTGLPNRNYFSEKVQEQISYAERHGSGFSIAVIDLNKFKSINDELGHQFGDAVLMHVAKRLRDGIREYDIAARLGGDEFILLLVETDIDSSIKLLERLHTSLIKPYIIEQNKLDIGASIGVAHYPLHQKRYAELFHMADTAMYLAKQSGGGIRVFES